MTAPEHVATDHHGRLGHAGDQGVEPGAEEAAAAAAGASSAGPSLTAVSLRAAHVPRAMAVAAAAVVPADSPPGSPLVGLLQALLPQHFPSATAAKRAIRRRLILRVPSAALASAAAPAPGAAAGAAAPSATAPSAPPLAPSDAASGAAGGAGAVAGPGAGAGAGAGAGPAGEPPHPGGLLVLSTGCTADPGDVLQLLARSGAGIADWLPDGGGGSDVAGTAADPRVGDAGGAGGGAAAAAPPPPPGLPVAYEDEHLAVVIKPPGIDTQGSGPGSAQGRLKYCLRPTPLLGALNRPQQVHRLDAPTGGLLLAAKTHAALRALKADLAERRVSKRYVALVKGHRSGCGTIDMPLSGKPCLTSFAALPPPHPPAGQAAATTAPAPRRGGGRQAEAAADATAGAPTGQVPSAPTAGGTAPRSSAAAAAPHASEAPGATLAATRAAPVDSDDGDDDGVAPPHVVSPSLGPLTKVAMWPHTGRTHQLRKHMAYTGTPMVGDARYRGPRPADAGAVPADPRVTCPSALASGPEAGAAAGSEHRGSRPEREGGLPREGAAVRCGAGASSSGDEEAEAEVEAGVGEACACPELIGGNGGGGGLAPGGDDGRHASCVEGGHPVAQDSSSCGAAAGFPAGGHEADAGRWEVHRPPVDADWVVAAAAAAAASGAACAGDVLSDGSPVSLCLWAVGLRFRHPVSGRRLEVDISGWADAVFDGILRREAAAGAAAAAAAAESPGCPR